LLQVLNTGHAGSLATIHANNSALALNRLTTCVLMSDVGLPFAAIRAQIADSINLLLHIERRVHGRRLISEVMELSRYDAAGDRFELTPLFRKEGTCATATA
jgi:pilus assembly protein CpaF